MIGRRINPEKKKLMQSVPTVVLEHVPFPLTQDSLDMHSLYVVRSSSQVSLRLAPTFRLREMSGF